MTNYPHKDNNTISDATLRNPEAFAEMARRYYGRIYFTALAIVRQPDMAEDITQETFLRAWLKRDTVKEPALLLQPWLVRIATNLALQWLRTGQQRSRLLPLIPMEEVTVEPVDDTKPDPRQAAGITEQRSQVAEAVMALPTELRQVVLLHYAEGLTPSDIARMNGEAPSTVTRRLDKARAQLRHNLESGLAAGLAVLKPRHRNAQKIFGLVTTAAVLPAATRAQLVQLAADTPPPPIIEAVPSAAHAAPFEEAGIMKSIIAKTGAAKLLAGAAAIAAVGGGLYSLNSLASDSSNGQSILADSRIESRSRATEITARSANTKISRRDAVRKRSNLATNLISSGGASSTVQSRTTLADRIAKLESERVTTSPELIVDEGETSGKLYFNLQVVDVAGYPVKGATIKPGGLRTVVKSGSWYGWPDVPAKWTKELTTSPIQYTTWTTNEQGIARAYVPQYTIEKVETGGITFTTTHPDYTPTHSDMMLTSVTKVVLSPGNFLDVIASDEKSSAPVMSNVSLDFFGDSDLLPEWSQRSDGTISIRRISQEGTKFYIKHTDAAGNVLLSDYQVVTFPRDSDGPLHVTLHPTYTVLGQLSANVPRPVRNGKVAAHIASGPQNCGAYAKTEVDIAPDGTFRLENMPAGTVQIWALADGYCSACSAAKLHSDRVQKFELRKPNQEYVLPMEPTATAKLKLVDADGNSVVGAMVVASPNVYREGCSSIWFHQKFQGTSDASGIAIIENHPPEKHARIAVYGEWELEPMNLKNYSAMAAKALTLNLAPGQVTEKTLTVYPKGTFVLKTDGSNIVTE